MRRVGVVVLLGAIHGCTAPADAPDRAGAAPVVTIPPAPVPPPTVVPDQPAARSVFQAATRSAARPAGPSHLLIDVAREAEGFRTVRVLRVDSALPKRRGGLRGQGWRYRVVAADGSTLHEGEIADPEAIRGEFQDERDPSRIEAAHVTQHLPVHFAIRVPRVDGARIEFFAPDPLGWIPFPRVDR